MPEENKVEKVKFDPGFYEGVPNDIYHRGSFGTSSSQLKKFCEKTAAHVLYELMHPKPGTDAMNIGTALHTLVLEPHQYEKEVAVSPVFNRRTNAGKAEEEAFLSANQGKLILNADQALKAEIMAKNVLSHSLAAALLEDTLREVSVFWWYKDKTGEDDRQYREMMKVRPDALSCSHDVIIDLKTTTDATFTGFQKSVLYFYYHLSAAMYLEGVNQCKPLLERCGHVAFTKFVFIVVESAPPYAVAVYELGEKFIEIGKHLYRTSVQKLSEAREQDWPAFPDEVRVIDPPSFAEKLWIV